MGQVGALFLYNLVLHSPARLFWHCVAITGLCYDWRIADEEMFWVELTVPVSWNNRLYLVGICFVSLRCVGTTTRVVKARSWNPGSIYSGPYVLLLRPDFEIALGLQ